MIAMAVLIEDYKEIIMAKITKTVIDKMIKEYKPEVQTFSVTLDNGESVDIEIREQLDFETYRKAAREMADLQFAVDQETGAEVYDPTLAPFVSTYILLKYFTNVPVELGNKDGLPDPKAVERIWSLRTVLGREFEWPDGYFRLSDAAEELVAIKRDTLKPLQLEFWAGLAQIVDSVKKEFGTLSEEDLATLADAVQKLGSLDQCKIVELMQQKNEI